MNGRIGPGSRAIVTGASWGIGEAFAEELAKRGAELLLVARTETRLLTIAADLQARYGVRVEMVTLDLAAPDGPRKLCEAASGLNFEPTLLVNNAGLGILGPFADLAVEQIREMINLNVVALTELTYRVLQGMRERGGGAIINIASASAMQPVPTYALYGSTKSYVMTLSEALWAECHSQGIRVVAVCPGAVDAGAADGQGPSSFLARLPTSFPRKVTREGVVASALAAVEHDRPMVAPGASPARFAIRLLPRKVRIRLTGTIMQRFPKMMTGTRRRDP